MPQAIKVNKYEYSENYQKVLEHIDCMRATLLENNVDPDEVSGDIDPDNIPNSRY